MRRIIIVLSCLFASAAPADNPETFTERSQEQARAVIDRAVEKLGGAQTLRSIETVRLHLKGETWPRLQMTTPEPPFEGGYLEEQLVIDFKNSRLMLEQRGGGSGFENHNTILIAGGAGSNYDHRGRSITPIPAAQASQQQFVQYHRRLPHLLLRQALDRASSLRYLGRETLDGKPHEVVTFVMADTLQVALYVDTSTQLVSKYELLFVDPLTGDDASEIYFSDYASSGRHLVPRTWRQRLAGEWMSRFELHAEFNPAISDQAFQVAAEGYTRVAPLPDTLEAKVEVLAPGVLLLQNVAGQNQNSLAVAFADHIVVIEAPGSSEGGDSLIERIQQELPGKPIRYLAITHHHGDHIGGVRSFIAERATVITTPGNRGVIEAMARAPQKDRLARQPRTPNISVIERGRHVLSDGTQRLELIDVGPNPHAKEMVIAYLPDHGIVFQGDLFFVPQNDAPLGAPQASTVSFAKRIESLGLRVERIAGVHGTVATREQFDRAMQPAR